VVITSRSGFGKFPAGHIQQPCRKEANKMADALWYALKVRSRAESVVASHLRTKDYKVFLPTYVVNRRWSDRLKKTESPLFPGYLFCHFDVQNRLPVLTTPGVQFIVGLGKIPEPVNDTELNAVRTVVESGKAYEPCPYLAVGDAVRITHGSLSGLTGVTIRIKSNCRLVVSVNLLQRSVAVEIDRFSIERVQPVRSALAFRRAAGM
jgi:transcription antitermination factor NusG